MNVLNKEEKGEINLVLKIRFVKNFKQEVWVSSKIFILKAEKEEVEKIHDFIKLA